MYYHKIPFSHHKTEIRAMFQLVWYVYIHVLLQFFFSFKIKIYIAWKYLQKCSYNIFCVLGELFEDCNNLTNSDEWSQCQIFLLFISLSQMCTILTHEEQLMSLLAFFPFKFNVDVCLEKQPTFILWFNYGDDLLTDRKFNLSSLSLPVKTS